MKKFLAAMTLLLMCCLPVIGAAQMTWQAKVEQDLPLLGHRNWIMIVDSAYPWQTSPGLETVETGSDQITVVREVLAAISRSMHVRPVVFMDAELPFLTEQEAPGVTEYRKQIQGVLGNLPVQSALHEQLIQEMNQTGSTFHILVLKTTLTVPYTSVFLRLDCKYWSDAAEKQLREAMKGRVSATPNFAPQ